MKQTNIPDDRFAEQWQKAFENKTLEPPSHVWDTLQTELSAQPLPKVPAKGLILNKIVLSTVAAVASVGLAYWLLTTRVNTETMPKPTPSETEIVVPAQVEEPIKNNTGKSQKSPQKQELARKKIIFVMPDLIPDSIVEQREAKKLIDTVETNTSPNIQETPENILPNLSIQKPKQEQQEVAPTNPIKESEKVPVLVEEQYFNPNALPSKIKTKRTKKGKFSFGLGGTVQQ
jgi:hypothetical protein